MSDRGFNVHIPTVGNLYYDECTEFWHKVYHRMEMNPRKDLGWPYIKSMCESPVGAIGESKERMAATRADEWYQRYKSRLQYAEAIHADFERAVMEVISEELWT